MRKVHLQESVSNRLMSLAALLTLAGSGCGFVGGRMPTETARPEGPVFGEIYGRLGQIVGGGPVVESAGGPSLTFRAEAMPLSEFCMWLSRAADVSIVVAADLDDVPVTVHFDDVDLRTVLAMIARRANCEVTQLGTVYYLGSLRREDRAVMVRKVGRLGRDDLRQAVEVLLSELGRLAVYDDGLVIVADRVQVLQRVALLLDQVETARSDSWVVQLYIVSVTDRGAERVGLDVAQSADIAIRFAAGSSDQSVTVDLDAALNAVLQAEHSGSGVSVVAAPMFLLLDGMLGEFSAVETVPLPRRSVSDQGTVTTVGYESIEAGLTVQVGIRELDRGAAHCSVDIGLSEITGFVEESPIIRANTLRTSSRIESGGVYLLGSLARDSTRDAVSGFLGLLRESENSTSQIDVWVRAYRVSGPVMVHPS